MPISTTSVIPQAGLQQPVSLPALRLPAWSGIFVGLLLLFLVVGRGSLFRDPGIFWHTAFGEQILSGQGIPTTDVHSLTRAGETWLDLQWLGECLMAFAWRWSGWDGALLLGSVVLAGTYAWLAQRFLAAGMNVIPVCVLLGLILAASSHHFHVRPHLASLGLLGVTVMILIDVDAGRRRVLQLGWLVPLFALWSNIHGGVLGGLASVCLVVGGWLVLPIVGCSSPLNTWSKRLAAILLASAAALTLLATPHGWDGLRTCIEIMRMPLPDVIQEHRPLNLLRVEGMAVLLLGLLYVAALRSAGRKQFRASWALPAVWLVLAVMRVRHAPLFAIVAGVTLADLIAHTKARAWLAEHGLWTDRVDQRTPADSVWTKPAHRRGWLLVTGLLGLVLVIQGSGLRVPLLGRGGAQLDQAGWPLGLAEDVRNMQAEVDRPLRLFNQLHYGGLLIFHSPKSQVFIDDRCELYGFELLSKYAEAEVSRPERIRDWHAEYHFDAALVMVGSPFDRFLAKEPDWHPRATDGQAVLYTVETPD